MYKGVKKGLSTFLLLTMLLVGSFCVSEVDTIKVDASNESTIVDNSGSIVTYRLLSNDLGFPPDP